MDSIMSSSRTQNFGIIPSDIRKKYKKDIQLSDEPGSLAITVSPLNTDHTHNIDISILKSSLTKKPKKQLEGQIESDNEDDIIESMEITSTIGLGISL
jgi:ACT domain-containing protein